MPVFTPVSQAEFLAAIHDLAAQVAADPWRPDRIVGIGRGGLVPAVYLSHATGLAMASVDLSGAATDDAAEALTRLALRARDGARLLLVDDINDSGRTIALLRAALAAGGAPAAAIRFATLIDNSASTERVDYRHRTIDRREVKDWFVFPWEAVAPAAAIAADADEVPGRLD
jgi:hypoxanthine phosphoribosyltransferase